MFNIENITVERKGPKAWIVIHFGPSLAAESTTMHKVGPALANAVERREIVDGAIEDLQGLIPEIDERNRGAFLAKLVRMGVINANNIYGELLRAPEILVDGYTGAGAAISADGLCVPQISNLGNLDEHQLTLLLESLEHVTLAVRNQLQRKRS